MLSPLQNLFYLRISLNRTRTLTLLQVLSLSPSQFNSTPSVIPVNCPVIYSTNLSARPPATAPSSSNLPSFLPHITEKASQLFSGFLPGLPIMDNPQSSKREASKCESDRIMPLLKTPQGGFHSCQNKIKHCYYGTQDPTWPLPPLQLSL